MAEWSIKIPGTKLGMKHYSDQLKDLSQALSEILHTQIEIQVTGYSDVEVFFFLVRYPLLMLLRPLTSLL